MSDYTPEDRDDQDDARSEHAAEMRSIAADEARSEWPEPEPYRREPTEDQRLLGLILATLQRIEGHLATAARRW